MPIGSTVVYNPGDLILHNVSSSGNTFQEVKIAAATSSIILFNANGLIGSQSLNGTTVGTASSLVAANSYTASNLQVTSTLLVGSISASSFIIASSFTGSLAGTASWSNNALTAALATSINFTASNSTTSQTASYLTTTNSYTVANLTASNISGSGTGSFGMVGIGTSTIQNAITIGVVDVTSSCLLIQSNIYNNLSTGIQITSQLGALNGASHNLHFARWGGGYYTDHASVGQSAEPASYDLQFCAGRQNTGSAINYFTSSAVRMTIKTSTGNVGIGTTSPNALLNVGSGTPSTAANGIQFGSDTSANLYRISTGVIKTDGGLTAAGNITIAKNAAYLYLNGTDGDSEIYFQANSVNKWAVGINVGDPTQNFNIYNYTTATTNLTILSASGNVGIGTASPSFKLHVIGDIATYKNGSDSVASQLYIANAANTKAYNFQLNSAGTSLNLWGYDDANGWKNNVTFAQGGNVGIGKTVPVNKLDVAGNISCSAITASLFFGTASVANALNTGNSYTITNLTASNINIGNNNNLSIGTSNQFHNIYLQKPLVAGANYQTLHLGTRWYWDFTNNVWTASSQPNVDNPEWTAIDSFYYLSFKVGNVTGSVTSLTTSSYDSNERFRISLNDVRVFNSGSDAEFRIVENDSVNNPKLTFYNATTPKWVVGVDAADSDKFKINKGALLNTTNVITINTSNNVGIGTTSPNTLLNVGSGTPSTAANGIQFGSDTSANLYRISTGTIKTDGGLTVAGTINGGTINASGPVRSKNPTSGFLITRRDTNDDAWRLWSAAGELRLTDEDATVDRLVVTTAGLFTFTGAISCSAITGSVFGTSSWSNNALTASYVSSSNIVGTVTSASYAVSSSFSTTAGALVTTNNYTVNNLTANATGSFGMVGVGTTVPNTLLNVGSGTPSTAANGIQFGSDTSANLYRISTGTIKTDGGLVVVGTVSASALQTTTTATSVGYMGSSDTTYGSLLDIYSTATNNRDVGIRLYSGSISTAFLGYTMGYNGQNQSFVIGRGVFVPSGVNPGIVISGVAGNQKVGINMPTTNSVATNTLDVYGNISASSFTGSVFGTSSFAISASYAPGGSGLTGGTTNYIPVWTGANSLSSSVMYQSGAYVGVGLTNPMNRLDVAGNISCSVITASLFFGTSSFATTATTANALNTGNNYTIAGLTVQSGSLSTVSGSSITIASFIVNNSNAGYLNIIETRFATGSDWTTARTRIQKVTDTTNQAYIDFNPSGSNYGIAFGTGVAVERMRIDSSGRVGVGTSNPVNKLDVAGNISCSVITASLFFGTSSWSNNALTAALATSINFTASNATTAQTASSLTIANSYRITNLTASNISGSGTGSFGMVGVGTAIPLGKLHVYGLLRVGGAVGDQTGTIALGNDTHATSSYGDNGMFRGGIGTLGGANYTNISSFQGIVFNVSNAEFGSQATRMLIDVNGNVGIGTTNPTNKLNVVGNISCSAITASLFFGTSSWATNATTAQTASSLTIANNYQVTSLSINTSSVLLPLTIHGTSYSASASGTAANSIVRISAAGTNAILDMGVNADASPGFAWLQPRSKIDYSVLSNLSLNPVGGNVGIGTINPTARLQLGTLAAVSTATPEAISLGGTYSSAAGSNPKLRVWTDGTYSMGLGASADQLDYILGRSNYSHVFYADGSQLMVIKGTGNVGIGTTNPSYKLQVVGSFSATTKSFDIEHPTKLGKRLVYGSLESPYHGVRLTGKGKLIKGKGVIQLPDYINSLVDFDNANVQITNIKHNKAIYVDNIDEKNNIINVVAKIPKTQLNKELEFYWTFTAVRKDVPNLQVEL